MMKALSLASYFVAAATLGAGVTFASAQAATDAKSDSGGGDAALETEND
jgi:hypothetical protein